MYSKELSLSFIPVGRASTVKTDVVKIQDWLRLNGVSVGSSGSDGGFGPATETGVKTYQSQRGLPVTGKVDQATWGAMIGPLHAALNYTPYRGDFGNTVVQIAEAHLSHKPVELDANRGPWVRTYCQGPDGPEWSWCQGFASTIWLQAQEFTNQLAPIDLHIYDQNVGRKIWCLFVPTMRHQAKSQGKLITAEQAIAKPELVPPGSMFYLRGGQYGWSHVGIVTGPAVNGYYPTIEGNTNAGGSTNGGEVCRRKRAISACDYGLSQ